MTQFLWPIRVYYEDTDSGGVVYYANYLKFMERARSEWLRSLGFEQDELIETDNVIFAVRKAELDFQLPARFNQSLQVNSKIQHFGRASLTFDQQIVLLPEGNTLCSGVIKVACLEASSFKPCAIPERIIRELQIDD